MILVEWKFKEGVKPVGSGEFWYDVTNGGYIRPEELLDDADQIEKLKTAIELVRSFEMALEDKELLNEF